MGFSKKLGIKRFNWGEEEEEEEDQDESLLSEDDEDSEMGSRSTETKTETNTDEDEAKEELARKETRSVFRLRLLVFFVLLLAAVAVSLVVLFVTRNGESDEFKTQYEGASNKIIETFESIVAKKIGAVSALAVAMIAHGVDHKRDWPLVTLSAFQERSAVARAQSGALFVKICPFVNETQLSEWEAYSQEDEDNWILDGIRYQNDLAANSGFQLDALPKKVEDMNIGYVHYNDYDGDRMREQGPGPFMPVWQTSPMFKDREVNINVLRKPEVALDAKTSMQTASAVIGRAVVAPRGGVNHGNPLTELIAEMESYQVLSLVEYAGDPLSRVFLPVFNSFTGDRVPVAVLVAYIRWGQYFQKLLPSSIKGITAVLRNSCDGPFTYEVVGEEVNFIGRGDWHSKSFEKHRKTIELNKIEYIEDGTEFGLPIVQGNCTWSLDVFPSKVFYDEYNTNTPTIITFAVAMVFIFTASMFFVYDRLVERRQRLIMRKAVKSSAIVASLFPSNVRDRLLEDEDEETTKNGGYMAPKHRIKSFLGGHSDQELGQKPIADLFPNATVMFCDIAGFTAWSSTRDPSSVFILLQSVYQAFDELAKKRKVFKVETIGDSYVAVTGVPEPQVNHAVIMARFAGDCLSRMNHVVKSLETELGPGTGDLTMRFGIHSGPVTAGVLRGDRSRFQLFGDTVNTAARMESTGMSNKVQASEATANLLMASGKGHWVKPREDMVKAKGKGVLRTYWVRPKNTKSLTSSSTTSDEMNQSSTEKESEGLARFDRSIDWVVELFKAYIKPILARQRACRRTNHATATDCAQADMALMETPIAEVKDTIDLPPFDPKLIWLQEEMSKTLELDDDLTKELRHFVGSIAALYKNNPFHNFEHACHVTMSVHKLIQRITKPDLGPEPEQGNAMATLSQIHKYTHGITSDPVTLFAIVFSALIHDVDHTGVSNTQLIEEEKMMASFYKNKSVAEQNSLTLSWGLLMSTEFSSLRSKLFADTEDLKRFRQVVVNVVLATDIFDKEENGRRESRWKQAFAAKGSEHLAFSDSQSGSINLEEKRNPLRSTIFIEHIIQASDVSHTMQHWHIYQKWNTCLFKEMSLAYKNGRMKVDPATFWYGGELKFFDNYIIPLSLKLKECGVFGVSSDECYNYAVRNRDEWRERGVSIVAEMVAVRDVDEN